MTERCSSASRVSALAISAGCTLPLKMRANARPTMPSSRRSKRCSTPTVAPLRSPRHTAVPSVIVAGPRDGGRDGTHDAPYDLDDDQPTTDTLVGMRGGSLTPRPGCGRRLLLSALARASGGMADAHGSGPCVRKDVGVQLPPCPLQSGGFSPAHPWALSMHSIGAR